MVFNYHSIANIPSCRPGRQNQSGVALVELALLITFLVLLVAGAVDIGLILRTQQSVADAARQAAREVASVVAENIADEDPTTRAWGCGPAGVDLIPEDDFPGISTDVSPGPKTVDVTCPCNCPQSFPSVTPAEFTFTDLQECTNYVDSDCALIPGAFNLGDQVPGDASIGQLAKSTACRHLCLNSVDFDHYDITPRLIRGVFANAPARYIQVQIQKKQEACVLCWERVTFAFTPAQDATFLLKMNPELRCWKNDEVPVEFEGGRPCDSAVGCSCP